MECIRPNPEGLHIPAEGSTVRGCVVRLTPDGIALGMGDDGVDASRFTAERSSTGRAVGGPSPTGPRRMRADAWRHPAEPTGSAQAPAAPPGQTLPEEVTDLGTGEGEGSKVFLFNCECHTFEEVIAQLLKAVPGMTRPLAEELAWRAHTHGLAEVYRGSPSECDRVAKVLGETGLIVQVL